MPSEPTRSPALAPTKEFSELTTPFTPLVPLPQVSQAPTLLLEQRADAVLAEDQQLRWAMNRSPRSSLQISLQGLQRESQAFALSPQLPEAIADRINKGLSALKRNGTVTQLQREAVNKS